MAKTKDTEIVNEKAPQRKVGPVEFFRQVRSEAKKVAWPTRHETAVSSLAVFIMVLIASIFLFFADQVIAMIIRFIMSFGL
ncbi:MAG: preprotein translocase subunit SecE [Alphaproteobacteria bacterium]|nr:preprotein translocase subunit SecE [Alphaproteobacteria bacterium]